MNIALTDYISVAEAADILRRTSARVYQMIDEGKLTLVMVGKLNLLLRSEVEALAAKRRALT